MTVRSQGKGVQYLLAPPSAGIMHCPKCRIGSLSAGGSASFYVYLLRSRSPVPRIQISREREASFGDLRFCDPARNCSLSGSFLDPFLVLLQIQPRFLFYKLATEKGKRYNFWVIFSLRIRCCFRLVFSVRVFGCLKIARCRSNYDL